MWNLFLQKCFKKGYPKYLIQANYYLQKYYFFGSQRLCTASNYLPSPWPTWTQFLTAIPHKGPECWPGVIWSVNTKPRVNPKQHQVWPQNHIWFGGLKNAVFLKILLLKKQIVLTGGNSGNGSLCILCKDYYDKDKEVSQFLALVILKRKCTKRNIPNRIWVKYKHESYFFRLESNHSKILLKLAFIWTSSFLFLGEAHLEGTYFLFQRTESLFENFNFLKLTVKLLTIILL